MVVLTLDFLQCDTYIGISASLHKVNCVLPPLIAYFINIFHY